MNVLAQTRTIYIYYYIIKNYILSRARSCKYIRTHRCTAVRIILISLDVYIIMWYAKFSTYGCVSYLASRYRTYIYVHAYELVQRTCIVLVVLLGPAARCRQDLYRSNKIVRACFSHIDISVSDKVSQLWSELRARGGGRIISKRAQLRPNAAKLYPRLTCRQWKMPRPRRPRLHTAVPDPRKIRDFADSLR